jgi:hypothetical protein
MNQYVVGTGIVIYGGSMSMNCGTGRVTTAMTGGTCTPPGPLSMEFGTLESNHIFR